jgi:hypothetical protein
MSISSIQANKFYKEVIEKQKVYTVKDSGGFPAPKNSQGKRSQPFWSSRSRVEKIIKTVPAYKDFEIVEFSLDEFKNKLLKELSHDQFLVGVNWSGTSAKGYDIEPDFILKCV